MKQRIGIGIFLLGLILPAPLSGEDSFRLPPVDESPQDPSFALFRENLLAAIQRKDLPFIKNILDAEIQFSFGGGYEGLSPRSGFLKFFELDQNPEKSPFWQEFQTALTLGCTQEPPSGFDCPYVFSRWPDRFDPFDYKVVIQKDAPLRKKPDPQSKVLRKTDYEILYTPLKGGESDETETEWAVIHLSRKKRGYILKRQLRSPIDYRALFEKKAGRWQLTAFIAGD